VGNMAFHRIKEDLDSELFEALKPLQVDISMINVVKTKPLDTDYIDLYRRILQIYIQYPHLRAENPQHEPLTKVFFKCWLKLFGHENAAIRLANEEKLKIALKELVYFYQENNSLELHERHSRRVRSKR
jgi:hypothetical protein